jgi:hypothetical protein
MPPPIPLSAAGSWLVHKRRIEDVPVLGERRQGVVEVAHRIGRPEL